MDQPTVNTLVERVRNLERENVRIKRLGMAAVLVLAAVGVLGQAKTTQVAEKLEARAFILRDAKVQSRGAFFVADNGAANLALIDKSGGPRLMVTVSEEGDTTLSILDQARRLRIALVGNKETFTMGISDSNNILRTSAVVAPDGAAMFSAADRTGVMRASLGVDAAGLVGLTIYNRTGKPIRNFGE
jgi:hypothetical protein